jgi:hypothetical protein
MKFFQRHRCFASALATACAFLTLFAVIDLISDDKGVWVSAVVVAVFAFLPIWGLVCVVSEPVLATLLRLKFTQWWVAVAMGPVFSLPVLALFAAQAPDEHPPLLFFLALALPGVACTLSYWLLVRPDRMADTPEKTEENFD